ncbi:hypothetical protein EDB81DRAFT_871643 [Dactylonectria macrodidyma]|uniref:Uncharacterized protein n=1 Tax=Dactylonectria macrodidyma TaxID=307937 RepID=A0A9P9DYN9_9HYPO|nr:hypothetical protein EDB81DRAFT_871643 [Dactylonectria macrodidyma]
MISPDALMEQPIPLRNPLIFYPGHIPTFEGIHLARVTDSAPPEPAYYHNIFELGIDPDIDDPSICHSHSELPDVFPQLKDILMYRERVRMRIRRLYDTGEAYRNRWVGRALWIGFEHEALHVETFLMTIQSPNIQPPPGLSKPDFAMLEAASRDRVANTWFYLPPQTFTIGFHDSKTDEAPSRFFAWGNEREPYDTQLPGAEQQRTPGAYGVTHCKGFISSHAVKTVWGLVPLNQALDWPVMASFNAVQGIHEHAEQQGKCRPDSRVNKTYHTDPRALFVDPTGTNSGFQNFHPVPIVHMEAVCGLGNTGGAAEWMRDLFEPQPGFTPMNIYPGYSADFVDGKHITIVGRS